ncbi:hypothetical protein CEXT_327071 [Caerostris extrusa]|uniref:Uncharacterized protein n=1 Tax=Caerostris extrusa TaxID=172846 RepID=A0AAV4S0E3_CAEEX|nr:hypothetical protein CEXT_327071 [Caerostris extrusa]
MKHHHISLSGVLPEHSGGKREEFIIRSVVSVRRTSNTHTNGKLVDMHFVYRICEGNGRNSEKIYRKPFPGRHSPLLHSLFVCMN